MNANLDVTPRRPALARTMLSVLVIVGLIAGCAPVLRPLVAALMWAAMIAVST